MDILSVSHLSQYFGTVPALVDVTFSLAPGQVLGVAGQRGSGKSTLFQLLSGVYAPTHGDILWDGKCVVFETPAQAQQLGIETVYQYPQLAGNLDVLQNVFLGRELSRTSWLGLWPKETEMYQTARDLFAAFEMPPHLITERASNLSAEQQQLVALARALCRPCRLLLLDDAFSALNFARQQKLLDRVRELAAQGVAVIVGSDDLKHLFALTDSILVLYPGRSAAFRRTAATTPREIVELIVGSDRQDQVTPVVWAFESYDAAERQAEELRRAQLELQRSLAEQDSLNRQLTQANTSLTRRAMQLEISGQVAQQVTSILDQDELFRRVVYLIQSRFGYYFVGIWLIAENQDVIVLRAGSGATEMGTNHQPLHIPIDSNSIIAGVCKTGARRLVEDVTQAPDYVVLAALPNTRSELALPFHVGHTVIGALDIESDHVRAFDPEDQLVLQTLADQIAIAIRNAQLYANERQRRRLAESLEQAGRELSSSLDMREVPGRILERLAAVVPYERGSIMLQQNDALSIIAQRGFPTPPQAATLRVAIRSGDVFQQVMTTSRPLLVEDVTQEPGWYQVEWLPLNRSWMGVPLVSKDRVIGMISLTRREARAFKPEEMTLVAAFAGQAAIALENAGLYDEIKQFNERLEQMVQERTEELNRAYHTLERLDQTKSNFIEVTAHELRTPLTVIRGYAQLLGPLTQGNPAAAPLLEGILSGQTRLHEVVNSMLDVTRIDSHALTLHSEPVNLAELIGRIHAGFRAALQERRLLLHTSGLDSLPELQADPDQLFKVFYHLIVNAIKYTPDGGMVTVTGRVIPDAPEVIEVIISDTGIGIDPAHHDLIFEKFYQTGEVAMHSSGKTKFKGGGPGLGLAIARGIVNAHGGRIWVESQGHDEVACPGSQFHVCLPLAP